MNDTGELLYLPGNRCPSCNVMVKPVRPPFPSRRYIMWIGLSLAAAFLVNGTALWLLIGFILWRNSKAVCPECGHEPIKGIVGWTRESIFLLLILIPCFIVSLWATFFLAGLLIWAATLLID